jgi:hypothetical protein
MGKAFSSWNTNPDAAELLALAFHNQIQTTMGGSTDPTKKDKEKMQCRELKTYVSSK